jgi:hypothetical protein
MLGFFMRILIIVSLLMLPVSSFDQDHDSHQEVSSHVVSQRNGWCGIMDLIVKRPLAACMEILATCAMIVNQRIST